MCDEVLPEVEPGVAWYCVELDEERSSLCVVDELPELELELEELEDDDALPATMELLGDRNWWFPHWLDRFTPRLHVEPATHLDDELAELTDEPAGVGSR